MNVLITYPDIEAWASDGEELAYTAAHLPYRIGEWYDDGVRQFGAPAVIKAIEANRATLNTGGKPEYPFLAQVSRHTCQNYATTVRAIKSDSRYKEYDFWHVEAVLGIPDTETRIKLLNSGKTEQMSVGKFRRYRDEEMGKLTAPPGISDADLNGRVAKLMQANHELSDAVQDYAAELAEMKARAADRQAEADERHPADVAYERDNPPEWYPNGCMVCPKCGRAMACPSCGDVQR